MHFCMMAPWLKLLFGGELRKWMVGFATTLAVLHNFFWNFRFAQCDRKHSYIHICWKYMLKWFKTWLTWLMLNYYGLPNHPVLHCCLYLWCLQSSVLLQDIFICEWPAKHPLLSLSLSLFVRVLEDPHKLLCWSYVTSNECCTLSSASLCSSHLGPFLLYCVACLSRKDT